MKTNTSKQTPQLPANRLISGGRRTLGFYHLRNAVKRIIVR